VLIKEKIKIKINAKNKQWYESKGYQCDQKYIEVFSKDLSKGCNKKVKVLCDYCLDIGIENIIEKNFNTYIRQNINSDVNKDSCSNCRGKKLKEIFSKKYGTDNPMKLKEIRDQVTKKQEHSYEYISLQCVNRNLKLIDTFYEDNIKKIKYVCLSHENIGEQVMRYANFRNGQGCKYCKNDRLRNLKQFSLDQVKQFFLNKNLLLLESEYINAHTKVKYMCHKHFYVIQETTLTSLKANKYICRFCSQENRSGENHHAWKGGISSLYDYLRKSPKIKNWISESMRKCKYKCVVTGSKKDIVVHHLYSYSKILQESIQELNFPIYSNIGQYSKEQLGELEKKCEEIHYQYPLGVCVTRNLHLEFHQAYGWIASPDEFEKFKREKTYELNERGVDIA
jgi:hypothetical protein